MPRVTVPTAVDVSSSILREEATSVVVAIATSEEATEAETLEVETKVVAVIITSDRRGHQIEMVNSIKERRISELRIKISANPLLEEIASLVMVAKICINSQQNGISMVKSSQILRNMSRLSTWRFLTFI